MPYLPPGIIQTIDKLNVEDVARSLGLNVSRHETKCFMHNDNRPSLKFHKNGHLWKCFVCDKGGGPINLVMQFFKIDYIAACLWLCNRYGIYIPGNNPRRRMLPSLKEYNHCETLQSTFNLEIGEWLISNAVLSSKAHSFLFGDRKLNEDVVNNLNIKSISDSKRLVDALRSCYTDEELVLAGYLKTSDIGAYLRLFTPCLLFPYYDINNNLLGIQTRYLGDKTNAPRFQFVAGFKPSIFNMSIVRNMSKGDDLYISEGVTDCLALLSSGYKAIAIPSASNLPIGELRALCKFNLIASVDRDDAGERVYDALSYNVVKMGGRISRLSFPADFKDYGEYYKSSR